MMLQIMPPPLPSGQDSREAKPIPFARLQKVVGKRPEEDRSGQHQEWQDGRANGGVVTIIESTLPSGEPSLRSWWLASLSARLGKTHREGSDMRHAIRFLGRTVLILLYCAAVVASFGQTGLMEPSQGVVTGVSTEQPYGGNLLVLLKPELGSQILGYVSNGDEVTIEEQIGSFYHITAPKDGWCWASYIKVTGSKPSDNNQAKQPLSIEEYFYNSKVTPKACELAVPDSGTLDPQRYETLTQELRDYWRRLGSPASLTP
jgi:hypothetical protein